MESELVATTREDDGVEDNRAEDDRAEDDGAEDDGAEDAMAELLCPICLQLLHQPHRLNPCLHLFCDPCLSRLARARIHTCPMCRSFITDCHLDEELHNFIENQYQDVYIKRQQVEMISGIFNEPLLPVRQIVAETLTVAEIFHSFAFVLLIIFFCMFMFGSWLGCIC